MTDAPYGYIVWVRGIRGPTVQWWRQRSYATDVNEEKRRIVAGPVEVKATGRPRGPTTLAECAAQFPICPVTP
jgi:hypothetical protein